MPEDYKAKSVTLPQDLIFNSLEVYQLVTKKTFDKINFSEVVRAALYCYIDANESDD